jgi:hypothetical protein
MLATKTEIRGARGLTAMAEKEEAMEIDDCSKSVSSNSGN